MGTTYTRQLRRFPTAGNKIVADGAPASTRIPLDMMYAVNNLEKTCPIVGYAQGFRRSSLLGLWLPPIVGTLNVSSGEFLIDQLPTVLPVRRMARLCWTLGMKFDTPASGSWPHAATVDAVTVYIAPYPYKGHVGTASTIGGTTGTYLGTVVTDVFDPAKLDTPYGVSKILPSFSITPGMNSQYQLFSNAAGTTSNIMPFYSRTHEGSELAPINLVATITLSTTDASATLSAVGPKYLDFTWWTEPE